MNINDLKKIGTRLRAEATSNLDELCKGPYFCKDDCGNTTNCAYKKALEILKTS